MPINQALLPEFDHEMANTRKTIERVPDEKLSWRPHEKSMTMARLAGHLAEMPQWISETMQKDSLDVSPPGGQQYKPFEPKSVKEILDHFDKNIAAARKALEAATDEQFMKPWTLLSGGKTIFTLPKAGVVRSMVMNHIIHHRGQLTVYLRLNGAPVPALYGPSADERGGM
jgi:uncharacterized damage-inducible protein DinB